MWVRMWVRETEVGCSIYSIFFFDFLPLCLLFIRVLEENGIFSLDFNENFDFCQFSGITFYHNKCNICQVKNVKFY